MFLECMSEIAWVHLILRSPATALKPNSVDCNSEFSQPQTSMWWNQWNLSIVVCKNQVNPDKHLSSYIRSKVITTWDTVKREYLVAIIFGGFSNMAIWLRINLVISNTGISKDWEVFIVWRLILANILNSPISPNKSSPIINRFTVFNF